MCEAILVKNGTKRERETLFILLNPYNSYISLKLEVAVLRARYCLLKKEVCVPLSRFTVVCK